MRSIRRRCLGSAPRPASSSRAKSCCPNSLVFVGSGKTAYRRWEEAGHLRAFRPLPGRPGMVARKPGAQVEAAQGYGPADHAVPGTKSALCSLPAQSLLIGVDRLTRRTRTDCGRLFCSYVTARCASATHGIARSIGWWKPDFSFTPKKRRCRYSFRCRLSLSMHSTHVPGRASGIVWTASDRRIRSRRVIGGALSARLCKIAGVRKVHPHRFRDTLAVEVALEAVPIWNGSLFCLATHR